MLKFYLNLVRAAGVTFEGAKWLSLLTSLVWEFEFCMVHVAFQICAEWCIFVLMCQTSLTVVCGSGSLGLLKAFGNLNSLQDCRGGVQSLHGACRISNLGRMMHFRFEIHLSCIWVDVVFVTYFVFLQLWSGGSNLMCYYEEEGCVRSASAAGVTFKKCWIT